MSERIRLVRGDSLPAIVCSIKDDTTGLPVNLTGATVRMYFRAAGSIAIQATVLGVITDAVNGGVVFQPSTAPSMLSGEPGNYEGEIEITFSDQTVQTVYQLLKFKIREDF